LRIPIVAAERFSQDRKTGALELLISTPLSIGAILRGHGLALLRYCGGPIVVALFIHFWPVVYLVTLQPIFSPDRSPTFAGMLGEIAAHLRGESDIGHNWPSHAGLLIFLGLIPVLAISWLSLASLSTYLSLRMKRPLAIPFVAIGLSHALPWLALAGVFALIEYQQIRLGDDFTEFLIYYSIAFIFEVVAQIFWIWFSLRQTLKHFRTSATDRYQPPKPQRWWHMRIA
jgi:hypothetical protein